LGPNIRAMLQPPKKAAPTPPRPPAPPQTEQIHIALIDERRPAYSDSFRNDIPYWDGSYYTEYPDEIVRVPTDPKASYWTVPQLGGRKFTLGEEARLDMQDRAFSDSVWNSQTPGVQENILAANEWVGRCQGCRRRRTETCMPNCPYSRDDRQYGSCHSDHWSTEDCWTCGSTTHKAMRCPQLIANRTLRIGEPDLTLVLHEEWEMDIRYLRATMRRQERRSLLHYHAWLNAISVTPRRHNLPNRLGMSGHTWQSRSTITPA
jgi:hypothetical protein